MDTAAWLTLYLVLRILFVLVLYSVLLVVVWHVRREIDFGRKRPLANLKVIAAGSDPALFPNRLLPIKAHTTIGSSKRNDIILNDPHISAQHATLHWRHGVWTLTDTSSHAATYVNDRPCRQAVAVPIQNRIQFGSMQFELVPA